MDTNGQEGTRFTEQGTDRIRFYRLLIQLYQAMHSAGSVQELSGTFVNSLASLFCANKISCMLLDEASRELAFEASQGIDPSVANSKVKLGESFCGRVAQEGKPLLVRDVEQEYPDLPRGRLARYQTRSFVIVPLKTKDKVLGVVSVTDKKDHNAFSDDDLQMASFMCNTAAVYIENLRLLERNKGLLLTDPLTGLYNNRYFHEQLLEEIYRAERYRRPLSILMLDIDNFTAYNEAHGYKAGDVVLRQIGNLLRENIRQVDMASRYGLDEFSVILPETRVKEALFVAEKIRENISQAVFTEQENRKSSLGMTRLTVSIGVAEHRIGLSREEFIRHVSAALLEAQEKGRNCVCVFK